MKTYMSISLSCVCFFALIILSCLPPAMAQDKQAPKDSLVITLNMDAVYNRPFLQSGKSPIAIGGYVEVNSDYAVTDGITEGLSFHMQRLTLFMSTTIKQRIKFLTEIEFEDGTEEINIEFAALDFELHPLLVIRGGIIMIPIGAFNQNHDGPKWEFVERPLSATTIIPSTWSNVGFGLHGKSYQGDWVWGYEAYLTNGFDDTIIDNEHGKTWLPATKKNPSRFEESFNGTPMSTLKTAIRHRKIGEIGLSWMGVVYNKFKDDGIIVDDKRRVDVVVVDYNKTIKQKLYITGEWAWTFIDVPDTYSQQYGRRQTGGYTDVVFTVLKKRMLGWDNARLNASVRGEYVDYNMDEFNETGSKIHDEVWGINTSLSFRPSLQTVIRVNYGYYWETDLLGNPPSKTARIQFGFSSYF